MEFLKSLFNNGALTFEQLQEALNAHNSNPENKDNQIKIGNIGNGDFVTRSKFNEKETEVTTLNATISTLNESIKKFDGVDVEGLKNAATQAEKDKNEALAKEKLDHAIDLALIGAKAKNRGLVKGALDLTAIKVKEGSKDNELEGFEEQITKLKESDSYLFDIEADPNPEGKGTPGLGGYIPNGGKAPVGTGGEEKFGFNFSKVGPAKTEGK